MHLHHTNSHRSQPPMPPFAKSDVIWFNGELTRWDDARVHVSAHALQYGTGVFEGMRSYDTADGPAIFRLDAHMRRFAASASYYEIEWPYSFEQLCDAILSPGSVAILEQVQRPTDDAFDCLRGIERAVWVLEDDLDRSSLLS